MKLFWIPRKIRPRHIRLIISYVIVLFPKRRARDQEEPKAVNLTTEVEVFLQTVDQKTSAFDFFRF